MLLLALVASAAAVDATFASAVGFSGRHADCTVCHNPAAPQAAEARLTGLPDTWRPGETYVLNAEVLGGPTPLLPGRPQGGFELEVEAGNLAPGLGMGDLMRVPRDGVITYEPAGTLQRSWTIQWQAPDLDTEPTPVGIWLAVMAANGDHDIQLNTSDGGERGDAVATLVRDVPPHPDVLATWQALPLRAPEILSTERTDGGWRVQGIHPDGNATHLVVLRDGVERRVETDAAWTLDVEGDLDVILRAEGAGRVSADVDLAPKASASTSVVLPLLAVLLARRFK